MRWYPECTQRSVPALPGPHRRKTALSQSHAHHSIHIARARYAASPRNKKRHPTHYQAPGRGRKGPTRGRERDGTKQPSLVSQSLSVVESCFRGRRLSMWVLRRGSPGRLWRPLSIAPIRAAGSHQPTPHPSSTLPHSLNPPAHTHPPPHYPVTQKHVYPTGCYSTVLHRRRSPGTT